MTVAPLILSAVVGALGWSLAEYLLHRFRGHAPTGTSVFKTEHLTHHARDYFTPTPRKIAMAAPVIGLLAVASILAAGPALGGVFVTSFTLTYISYEVVHRRIHTHPPRGWYSRLVRRHHLLHHFVDARLNHGVTSPVWDIVFRTYANPERVGIHGERGPHWLVDRERGELRPEYEADYEVKRRRVA